VPSPAFVRLAKNSANKSREIDEAPSGAYPELIDLTCEQVPSGFGPGSLIWLWLGSDNNKGKATSWEQGIRAYGVCEKSEKIDGGKTFKIILKDIFLLPRSVTKIELLQASPSTYAQKLAEATVIGLENYASQVVQLLDEDEFATIGALIVHMIPEVYEGLTARIPDIVKINIAENSSADADTDTSELQVEPPKPAYTSNLDDDDPVLTTVRQLIERDGFGGVLLIGPPGTGKSWYAKQIAIKLTGGDRQLIRLVQFRPSYQYEDFVEGYVPHGSTGFRLKPKHLVEMIDIANDTSKSAVIVIDEFSRTDPARVLGEVMTYMEGSLRGVEFCLPSGRVVAIPKNLIFIATMNPDDRSVDEINDAMDRRWAKYELKPDAEKLKTFLKNNGTGGQFIGAVYELFKGLQEHTHIGHAFFRNVDGVESLKRLWESQLRFIIQKKFRYDNNAKRDIFSLWENCLMAIEEKQGINSDQAASDETGANPNTQHIKQASDT
jgi:5-methylcytosine-specific restriction enzyme B